MKALNGRFIAGVANLMSALNGLEVAHRTNTRSGRQRTLAIAGCVWSGSDSTADLERVERRAHESRVLEGHGKTRSLGRRAVTTGPGSERR